MNIKTNYLFSRLHKFLEYLGNVSKKQGDGLHQNMKLMEERYQGLWVSHDGITLQVTITHKTTVGVLYLIVTYKVTNKNHTKEFLPRYKQACRIVRTDQDWSNVYLLIDTCCSIS